MITSLLPYGTRSREEENSVITHVHSAGVPVKDQDAALDFQVNKLGWDVQIDQMMGEDERYLTVAPKGGQTQVALMKDDGTIKHWFAIALVADDLDATYAELSAKGVEFTFTMPVTEMPGGDKWPRSWISTVTSSTSTKADSSSGGSHR